MVQHGFQVDLYFATLQWRHSGHNGVSNPQRCVINHLFRLRSKKTWKLRVTGLCVGNSLVTGEFPTQRASNAENVSIWWWHHNNTIMPGFILSCCDLKPHFHAIQKFCPYWPRKTAENGSWHVKCCRYLVPFSKSWSIKGLGKCYPCMLTNSINSVGWGVSSTHWGWNKMAVILQTFWNIFSWMKIFGFWSKFYWNWFPREICHHWFR